MLCYFLLPTWVSFNTSTPVELYQRQKTCPITQVHQIVGRIKEPRLAVHFSEVDHDSKHPNSHHAQPVFDDDPMNVLHHPRQRKRALTNPLPDPEWKRIISYIRRSRQKNEPQAQSIFFSKLPLELRELIYEEVLAGRDGRLLHIIRTGGKLAHWRCRVQNEDGYCDPKGLRCLEGWLRYKASTWHPAETGRLRWKADGGLLPLLRTCRAV